MPKSHDLKFKLKARNVAIVVLLLCFLPLVTNLFGVDYGSQSSLLNNNLGPVHHILLEWTAVIIACICVIVGFWHYRVHKDVTVPILTGALLCAGMVDAFHVLAAANVIFANDQSENFITFTWALSRVFHSLIILLAAAVSLGIYRKKIAIGHKNRFIFKVLLSYLMLVLIVLYFAATSTDFPQTIYPDSFIKRPFDIIPLALFICCAVSVGFWFQMKQLKLRFALLLSMLPEIAAQMHMGFGSIAIYDNHFNIAHFFKVFAYFIILIGLVIDLVSRWRATPAGNIQEDLLEEETLEVGKVRHSIGFKMPLTGFSVSIIIVILVGGIFYFESKQLIFDGKSEELKIESRLVSPLVGNLYDQASSDLEMLKNLPAVVNMVITNHEKDLTVYNEHKDNFHRTSISLLASRHLYNKITYAQYLGNNESLVYSVSYEQDNRQTKSLWSSQELIPTFHEKVIQEPIKFSDVFVKDGLAGETLAVVKASVPVYVGGELSGEIQIEINFDVFINKLVTTTLKDVEFYLINDKSQFVYHPENSKRFGGSVDKQFLVDDEFEEIDDKLSLLTSGFMLTKIKNENNESLLGYLSPLFLSQSANAPQMYFILKKYNSDYIEKLNGLASRAAFIGLSLAFTALAIALFASRKIIKPLIDMETSVRAYEQLGTFSELPVKEKDEIGVLARSFNNFFISLKQQKRMQEQATRDAQDATLRLQSILDAIGDAVVNIDSKGLIVTFNKAAERIFGYKSEEIIGQNVKLLMPSHYAQQHDAYIEHYNLSHKSKIIGQGRELPAIRRDGSIFTMYLVVSEVEGKDGKIFTGLIRDLTEQKLLEAERENALMAAKDNAWRLDFALTAPGIGVWDYNIYTDVTSWDERVYQLYGYDAETGLSPDDIWRKCIHPDDVGYVEKRFKQSIENGKDLNQTYRVIKPNNQVVYIESHAQVVRDGRGNIFRIVGTNRDITEQLQLQELKQQALEMAQESLKLKSEFLASMSHEIRTPMNGVIGMLDLLDKTKLDTQQNKYLHLASSSATALLTIINDILDFSKIEAGKLEIESIDFDLHAHFGNIAEAMANKAQEKGINLVLDLEQIKQPNVIGDPSRLQQIITNLISNAIKFTQTGEVIVKGSLDETFKHDQVKLSVTVTDTGIGIPKDKLKGLFDSFTQVDASTTRQFGGTGLGLAIVKQLCQLMDGDVSVKSDVSKGSEFSFDIVMRAAIDETPYHPPQYQDINIIVVDDNVASGAAITNQLKAWQANVLYFDNAKDTLSAIQEHEPGYFSLVVISSQIKGLKPTTFAAQLLHHENSVKLQLILMTLVGERLDKDYLESIGFSASFIKPATISDLHGTVTKAMIKKESKISQQGALLHKGIKVDTQSMQFSQNHVLVVEDNRVNQAVISGVLKHLGINFEVAENGKQAIQVLDAESNQTQLVLMDCQMPEMDGYEATRYIRSGQSKNIDASLPIIAMTANAMKGDKEKCLNAGMNDYLSKPIDAELVEEKLHYWLKGKKVRETINPDRFKSQQTESTKRDVKTESESNKQVLNIESLGKRVRDNQPMIKKLLSLYVEDSQHNNELLEEAVTSALAKDIAHAAHKIKGSSSNIGAECLTETITEIEKLAKVGKANEIMPLYQSYKIEYQKLLDAITEFEVKVS